MKLYKKSRRKDARYVAVGVVALAAMVGIAGCTPSSAPETPNGDTQEESQLGISDADYSLDALIAAAKKEGPITVVDSTGKIVDMAKNFTAKYGIEATGVKMKVTDQVEVITREAQADNVKTDAFSFANVPTAASQLVPQGFVVSWMPPDLKDALAPMDQAPLVKIVQSPLVWAYNTEIYGDTCPVDNIWDLTTNKWKGKVTFEDPLLLNEFMFWFNQMQAHSDKQVADAYKDAFGKDIDTSKVSATKQWVKALAENKPLLTKKDDNAAEAVGAPGQTEGFIGFMTVSKFRSNADSGYKLGLCSTMRPWIGEATPKVALIATGTKSPNAAKLFVHFMLTEGGIAPQIADGKVSTNKNVPFPTNDAAGIEAYWDLVYFGDTSTAGDDFAELTDWQDFWTVNSR